MNQPYHPGMDPSMQNQPYPGQPVNQPVNHVPAGQPAQAYMEIPNYQINTQMDQGENYQITGTVGQPVNHGDLFPNVSGDLIPPFDMPTNDMTDLSTINFTLSSATNFTLIGEIMNNPNVKTEVSDN
jgi:hypothetical protein